METLFNLFALAVGIASIFYCIHLGKEKGIPGAWAYGFLLGPLGVLWLLAKKGK